MKRTRIRKSSVRRNSLTKSERDEMDRLCRNIVMRRAGARIVGRQDERGRVRYIWTGQCQWCKRELDLQWAHIHSRGASPAMKWDPDNAIALCAHCHIFRWHKDPEGERESREEMLEREVGKARRDRLSLRSRLALKPDYQAMLIELRKRDEG